MGMSGPSPLIGCAYSMTVIFLLQDDFGETALARVCDLGHTHIVDILVKSGANVNQRTKVRDFSLIAAPVEMYILMH